MFVDLKNLPKVSYEGMNGVHEREVKLLNELYDAILEGNVERVDFLLEEFLKDVEGHFSYEEDLMRRTGFFAFNCHFEEHQRVRKELERVKKEWKVSKDLKLLAEYLEKTFKPWISQHILTMDTVTAEWVSSLLNGLSLRFGRI